MQILIGIVHIGTYQLISLYQPKYDVSTNTQKIKFKIYFKWYDITKLKIKCFSKIVITLKWYTKTDTDTYQY